MGDHREAADMRRARFFNNLSAWSPDASAVTGESGPAPRLSQPRLTPESVRDFDVHQVGSADGDAPQTERPGAARRGLQRKKLPVEFGRSHRHSLALVISRGCPGAEQRRKASQRHLSL